MPEPGQSSSGVALDEAVGSHFFEKRGPTIAEDKSSASPLEHWEKNKSFKKTKEFFEQIILKHAMSKEFISSSDTSGEEKATNRRRILTAKTTRWRIIFSQWPRDPKGKYAISLAESSELGKMVPNNAQLWGATLFDFFFVKPLPESMDLIFSSGSKLAAWMKANGEDYAKNHLEFAENEEDPYLILPYEITGLVQDADRWEQSIGDKKSWIRDEEDKDVIENRERKNKEREYWQVPQPWPPASPFDLLAYPKPWPDEPFTRQHPRLEKYIMQSHLPTILKVHDPWNLLRSGLRFCSRDKREDRKKEEKKGWSEKPDVVRTYRLNTSTTKTSRRTEDDRLAEAEEARRKAVYDAFIADPHSRNETPTGIIIHPDQGVDDRKPGPAKPLIFVVLPFRPPIPPAREAHLYLSPSQSLGQGNHSFVYSAEFELPRSTLMEDEICHECIKADVYRTLMEQDGLNGEHRDPKWDEKLGRYVMKTGGKHPRKLAMDDEDGVKEYLIQPSTLCSTLEYEGPYRLIHSKIGYQCLERGPYCEHIATSPKGIHPLTAKVRVAAKLSMPYDTHLDNEAEVYQAFPRDFFEHWSGFNVIEPLKVPTPVGPLVPQFYGYYVPDIDTAELYPDSLESESPDFRYYGQYFSPILLLEDCGQKLDPEKLTLDDQSEAAALVFRFHNSGWIHGSVANRNILIQPGPLSDIPLERHVNSKARDGHGINWDLRLIDFGRAYKITDQSVQRIEYLIKEEERELYRLISVDDFN